MARNGGFQELYLAVVQLLVNPLAVGLEKLLDRVAPQLCQVRGVEPVHQSEGGNGVPPNIHVGLAGFQRC